MSIFEKMFKRNQNLEHPEQKVEKQEGIKNFINTEAEVIKRFIWNKLEQIIKNPAAAKKLELALMSTLLLVANQGLITEAFENAPVASESKTSNLFKEETPEEKAARKKEFEEPANPEKFMKKFYGSKAELVFVDWRLSDLKKANETHSVITSAWTGEEVK